MTVSSFHVSFFLIYIVNIKLFIYIKVKVCPTTGRRDGPRGSR